MRVHPSHEHPTNDTRNLTKKKNTHTHTVHCALEHTHAQRNKKRVRQVHKTWAKKEEHVSQTATHTVKDVPIVEMAGQIQNELIWILIKNQLAQQKKKKC